MKQVKLQRISSNIQKEISNILANESNDDILKSITITGCETNNDLSISKVYFTSLSNLSHDRLEKELEEASSYIRKELASRIEVRHTPKLVFIYDNSISYGEKIEKIIEELHEE